MTQTVRFLVGLLIAFLGIFSYAQNGPTYKIMDDWGGDLELLRSIYSKEKPNIDLDFYTKSTKYFDRNVNLGNAFAYKRETERLQAIALSRRDEFRSATFVVLVGYVGPDIASYDFKTKSFHVTFGPTVRSLVGAVIPILATPTGIHVLDDNMKHAEYVESNKAGHMGTKQQTVEVFRMKGIQEGRDSRGQLIAERVAFFKYDDNANMLTGVYMTKTSDAEKNLIDLIGYDGKMQAK